MTEQAFEGRVNALRGTLFRVASAYLTRECDRADAVQEALLKAWRGLNRLRREELFKTWLIRILIRECINILRQNRRMIPAESLPDTAAPQKDDGSAALGEALRRLPDEMRIVVTLFYMDGFSTVEIARALGVPKGTVCSRLARARRQMRETLGEEACE